MRINEKKPAAHPELRKLGDIPSPKGTDIEFRDMLNKQNENLTTVKLNQLLKQIDLASERLAKSRTARELMDYKNLIKSFIDEVTKNGLEMEDKHGTTRRGRSKNYKMISEVDKKLVDLTNDVINKEVQGIDLLGKMGEIKGLLVNMYL